MSGHVYRQLQRYYGEGGISPPLLPDVFYLDVWESLQFSIEARSDFWYTAFNSFSVCLDRRKTMDHQPETALDYIMIIPEKK